MLEPGSCKPAMQLLVSGVVPTSGNGARGDDSVSGVIAGWSEPSQVSIVEFQENVVLIDAMLPVTAHLLTTEPVKSVTRVAALIGACAALTAWSCCTMRTLLMEEILFRH